MPPRKSTEARQSIGAAAEDDTVISAKGSGSAAKAKDGLGVEDLTLPRTMIQRLAKGVLPSNTQIQKDALLAIHKSATVFVGYLTNSANDRAVLANKKTIQPKDVLEALAELEFEGFLPRCEKELELYNTVQCTKRNDYRRRVKNEREAVSESALAGALGSGVNGDGGHDSVSSPGGHDARDDGEDSEPATKKIRTLGGAVMNGEEHEGDDTISEGEEDEEGDELHDEDDEIEEDGDSGGEEGVDEIQDTLEMAGEGRYAGEGDDDDEEGSGSD